MNNQIEIPTNCPSCSYPLQMVEMQLFCKNTGCNSRSSKQVEHFCKSVKIKGMGEKTIQKLNLMDITELYSLTEQEITVRLGSEKIATKLYTEIQNSKKASLSSIIAGFGIPLIGNTAAAKLCSIITNIEQINHDLCKAAGLGDIATDNLLNFLGGEFKEIKQFLPFSFINENVQANVEGKSICITGRLLSFKNKAEANEELVRLGFNVVGSVTKELDYLVDEEHKGSSKRLKADSFGVKIISDLSKFLREN